MLLRLENVTKRFGGVEAVNGLNLELEKGCSFAVVGPNGSGKTTLFNIINGIFKPDEGRVFFEGRDITQVSPYERAKMGIGRSFQIPRPFRSATVRENAAIGAIFGTLRDKIKIEEAFEVADHYLNLIGLYDKRNFSASRLSIIETKMLEVARALSMKPKILLLDEVCAGMGPVDIDKLIDLINEIKEVEKIPCIVLVEHRMRAVMKFADKLMVMHQGKKLMEGPPETVLIDSRVVEIYIGKMEALKR